MYKRLVQHTVSLRRDTSLPFKPPTHPRKPQQKNTEMKEMWGEETVILYIFGSKKKEKKEKPAVIF